MKIKGRLILLVISGMLILGAAALSVSIYFINYRGKEEIASSRSLLMEDRKDKLKDLVNSAYGIIENTVKKSDNSRDILMEETRELIGKLRFGQENDNYFWINDTRPGMIMHPLKPELNGKDLSDLKDPEGKRLFVDMVDICKNKGEGFVEYMWEKPGFVKPVQKLSFVKLNRELNWIVGAGIGHNGRRTTGTGRGHVTQ